MPFILNLFGFTNTSPAETIREVCVMSVHAWLAHNILVIGSKSGGSSDMLRRKNGVHTVMNKIYPDIISRQCHTHNLDFAVYDSLRQ